jgi:hypothetical protein
VKCSAFMFCRRNPSSVAPFAALLMPSRRCSTATTSTPQSPAPKVFLGGSATSGRFRRALDWRRDCDWSCSACQQLNFGSRTHCFACEHPRVEQPDGGTVAGAADDVASKNLPEPDPFVSVPARPPPPSGIGALRHAVTLDAQDVALRADAARGGRGRGGRGRGGGGRGGRGLASDDKRASFSSSFHTGGGNSKSGPQTGALPVPVTPYRHQGHQHVPVGGSPAQGGPQINPSMNPNLAKLLKTMKR